MTELEKLIRSFAQKIATREVRITSLQTELTALNAELVAYRDARDQAESMLRALRNAEQKEGEILQ